MVFDAMVYRGLIALALGLGVALGALGLFIIEQLQTRRRLPATYGHGSGTGTAGRPTTVQHRREAGSLTNKPANRNARSTSRRSITSISSDGTSDTVFVSAIGSTQGDNEVFNDFSDNESETGDSELRKLLREVDDLLRGDAEQQQIALYLLEQNYNKYSKESEVLWRLAQASHAMAMTVEGVVSPERKKATIQKGCEYAERAMKLNPSSYQAHKWYAINVGARGMLSNLREGISDGALFKKHIDEALKLKPNDDSLHYLVGRFNFKIASLSWLERSMASAIFSLPSVSIEDALRHFLMAEKLTSTPCKENRLFIAQCHHTLGNVTATVEWLEKAAMVENLTYVDEEAEKILRDLSNKYASNLRYIKKWD